MIIKLRKESTKRCLNHIKFFLSKFFKIFFFLISFFLISILNANECTTSKSLKVGLINNDIIDYQYYLYYELGNYAAKNELEFEIQIVENNPNEFDIIFGEFYDLSKLSKNNVTFPPDIKEYYNKNNIVLSSNILPLDLDTFIIASKNKQKKIFTLEELSNYFDPIRYTLGVSFKSDKEVEKIFNYLINNKDFSLNDIENESLISNLKKGYKNYNKNILSADYLEVYYSFENNENVFTLLNDGVLLNKNFIYEYYQLLPQSKYQWDKEDGIFLTKINTTPFSFYGFSAYINNTNQFGFLCHLTKENVRKNSFKNFNIALSPLSAYEVENFDELPKGYLDILNSKNKNILEIDYKNFSSKFDLITSLIFGNQEYQNIIETNDYLNK